MNRRTIVIIAAGIPCVVVVSVVLSAAGLHGIANSPVSVGITIALVLLAAHISDRIMQARRASAATPETVLAEQIELDKERKRKFLHNPTGIESTTTAVRTAALEKAVGKEWVRQPIPHLCSGNDECHVCEGSPHRRDRGIPVREVLTRLDEERLKSKPGGKPADADQG